MHFDLAAVAEAIREVAAREILPRFRNLADGDIDAKRSGEIVTVADRAAESALAFRLRGTLPGSVVIGEEAASADPGIVDSLADAPWVWIVDPIDGTRNFAAGIEDFVTMVALVRRGETVAGWICRPRASEIYVAESGSGAFCGERALAVMPGRPLGDMNGAFAKNLFSEPEHDAVARLEVALAGHRNRGCIGLDYVDMITATVDIAATGRLHPWDHAAGVLIHAEAGGHTALADGIIYRPDVSAGVMISAADENSWRAVRDVMYPDGNYPASG